MEKNYDIPLALYHAALSNAIQSYMEKFQPNDLERAMENRAIRTLEAIRQVLEDEEYNDPECFERVDALVMLFFRELEIKINRHNELD